jgi:hypothetical protein
LTALGERLFGAGIDLGDTLAQREEPGVCRLGEFFTLLLLGEVGVHRLY